jgi:hypothetical protein
MNIPLGLALTELIAETRITTVAHHHDFYWERDRFMVNAVADYLTMAFPPNLPKMLHLVINSFADEQLSLRKKTVDLNYELGKKFFSYSVLKKGVRRFIEDHHILLKRE